MTAYSPLLGRLIEQTILTHTRGQFRGILSIASRNVRTPSGISDLIESAVQIYQFRVLEPNSPEGVSVHDTVKVAQTSSRLVAVGDTLKIISLASSPYTVVREKTGWTAIMITNTVRYLT